MPKGAYNLITSLGAVRNIRCITVHYIYFSSLNSLKVVYIRLRKLSRADPVSFYIIAFILLRYQHNKIVKDSRTLSTFLLKLLRHYGTAKPRTVESRRENENPISCNMNHRCCSISKHHYFAIFQVHFLTDTPHINNNKAPWVVYCLIVWI